MAFIDDNHRQVAQNVAEAVVWDGASAAKGALLGHARRFERPFVEASGVFRWVAPGELEVRVNNTETGSATKLVDVCGTKACKLIGLDFTSANVVVCTKLGVLLALRLIATHVDDRWKSNVVHVYLWEGTGQASSIAERMASVDFVLHAQSQGR